MSKITSFFQANSIHFKHKTERKVEKFKVFHWEPCFNTIYRNMIEVVESQRPQDLLRSLAFCRMTISMRKLHSWLS